MEKCEQKLTSSSHKLEYDWKASILSQRERSESRVAGEVEDQLGLALDGLGER